jgi:hypothetical protein
MIQAGKLTEWWIVETEKLGITACPSRLLAHQAAEVCRGAPNHLRVTRVRIARPNRPEDAIAIRQAEQEIAEVGMDQLNRSGALRDVHRPRRDTGRVFSMARV